MTPIPETDVTLRALMLGKRLGRQEGVADGIGLAGVILMAEAILAWHPLTEIEAKRVRLGELLKECPTCCADEVDDIPDEELDGWIEGHELDSREARRKALASGLEARIGRQLDAYLDEDAQRQGDDDGGSNAP